MPDIGLFGRSRSRRKARVFKSTFDPYSSSDDEIGFSIDEDVRSFRKFRKTSISRMRSGDFDLVPLSSDDSVDRHVLADFRYSFTHIADALNLLVNIDPDNHDYDYLLEVS